jgi:methionine-rich copper-binding protein CopC
MKIMQRAQIIVLILAATMVCLSAGVAFAEVVAPPRPAGASPSSIEAAPEKSALEAAVADCERMWDRGTHMTKTEWSQTCRRVQNRIQQLELR